MKTRSSALVGLTGLVMMATAVPAFADDTVPETGTGIVAPPVVADDAAVEPGSVTEAPAPGAIAGEDSTEVLNEDAAVPGETDGAVEVEDQDPVYPGKTGDGDLNPDGLQCGAPRTIVNITSNKANTMAVKYSTFVKNSSSSTIDFKFTSKKSGTTTVGASVTLSTELKALWVGKIKVDVNASVTKSWTSELGIETGGKVRAHSTVYGDYGIMKENVYGYSYTQYSNCTTSAKTYATVWAPYREGWVIH